MSRRVCPAKLLRLRKELWTDKEFTVQCYYAALNQSEPLKGGDLRHLKSCPHLPQEHLSSPRRGSYIRRSYRLKLRTLPRVTQPSTTGEEATLSYSVMLEALSCTSVVEGYGWSLGIRSPCRKPVFAPCPPSGDPSSFCGSGGWRGS